MGDVRASAGRTRPGPRGKACSRGGTAGFMPARRSLRRDARGWTGIHPRAVETAAMGGFARERRGTAGMRRRSRPASARWPGAQTAGSGGGPRERPNPPPPGKLAAASAVAQAATATP